MINQDNIVKKHSRYFDMNFHQKVAFSKFFSNFVKTSASKS